MLTTSSRFAGLRRSKVRPERDSSHRPLMKLRQISVVRVSVLIRSPSPGSCKHSFGMATFSRAARANATPDRWRRGVMIGANG